MPFLAYNTRHAAITTLGNMEYGIEILLNKLSSVHIAADGQTAKIGGGTGSKKVTHDLWNAGKQTVTGTCECVSLMGPGLGGGHGWLQGHYGLVSDQFVSMNVVLADGSLQKIDATSELFWAMKGTGQNFGIVTSVTSKIYDLEHPNWAIVTMIFSGDKVKSIYEAANEYLVDPDVDVINWSYWLNDPATDPERPIVIMYILQEAVTTVDPAYTQPFYDIGPIAAIPNAGSYLDLASWTGIADTSPPCQKSGTSNPRFPIYLDTYNPEAMEQAYGMFADRAGPSTVFNNSIFMFEAYATQGVKAIGDAASAFAHRSANLLTAPLISYTPKGDALDVEAAELGNALRTLLHQATGQEEYGSYVNYAYGNEGPKSWYGKESWRHKKLKSLKNKYDPSGKFSYFGPVV